MKMAASVWQIPLLALFMSAVCEASTTPQATAANLASGNGTTRSNKIEASPDTATSHNQTLSNATGAIKSVAVQQNVSEKQVNQLNVLKNQLLQRVDNGGNPGDIVATKGLDANGSLYHDLVLYFKNNYQMIYPGTLWCGDGDRAKNNDSLGFFSMTDRCCRDHDFCSDYMEPGEIKNGLKNSGLFSRFNCTCDLRLYNCLNEVDSLVSRTAGFVYFDVLAPQCYMKEYPIIRCEQEVMGKCVNYWVNTTQPKRIQWIDNPIFIFSDDDYCF